MILLSIVVFMAALVATSSCIHITNCTEYALWCMNSTITYNEGREGRDSCQQTFISCSACTALEIACRTAATAANNPAADLNCTVEAQNCYHEHLAFGWTVRHNYDCDDMLATCAGGASTEHCGRQKELCDRCAAYEAWCYSSPGTNKSQCLPEIRGCFWDAVTLNETIYDGWPCNSENFTTCPGPLTPEGLR